MFIKVLINNNSMIGGGWSSCERADLGVGIKETNAASFIHLSGDQIEFDFGYDARTHTAPSQSTR